MNMKRPKCKTCMFWGPDGGTGHRDGQVSLPCNNPKMHRDVDSVRTIGNEEVYLFLGYTDYFEMFENFGCVLHEPGAVAQSAHTADAGRR